ncbi:septum formation inhibitor Maf [uncultured Helicobacter sp.]|uniref:septum formation inhibitor Maf n=1 Tax=uncultured Helicobacter sp. TaxID=175537 RepID=UPI00261C6D14|nr:septum formation inhibitor Maf [uncultured Helicobacter sp.]
MLRLCSTSIVRKQILKAHKIPFIQCDNGFDEEQLPLDKPKNFVYQAALGKHKSALMLYGLESPLLIVDSVIDCGGILQRKAKNEAEAREFLEAQNGKTFKILTCAILHCSKFFYVDLSQTCFELFPFVPQDLESYLKSGAWKNKAGAVMVEGFHQNYIKCQIGTTSNAMGLNIESLLPFLRNVI